jgi:hypothetical protein
MRARDATLLRAGLDNLTLEGKGKGKAQDDDEPKQTPQPPQHAS